MVFKAGMQKSGSLKALNSYYSITGGVFFLFFFLPLCFADPRKSVETCGLVGCGSHVCLWARLQAKVAIGDR